MPGCKDIYEEKLRHNRASEVLKEMWRVVSQLDDLTSVNNAVGSAMSKATQNGIVEFINEFINYCPQLLKISKTSVFHDAIKYRQEKDFRPYPSSDLAIATIKYNDSGDFMSHTAAKKAPIERLNQVPGAASKCSVSAFYEKALLDARKQIEREMERFKFCERETKTKAFSKEGRGAGVKKGKTRPPRLTHLETSISRHNAHIVKLELILRLLDNDELSPEQVNDVRDFLEDNVERNQDDFEEFSDVDELYNSLPLEKVEGLEDLVTIVPPGLVKGAANAVLGLKTSLAASTTQMPASLASTAQQGNSIQDPVDDTSSQDSNFDIASKSPPSKNSVVSSVSSTPTGNHSAAVSSNVSARTLVGGSTATAILSGAGSVRGVLDNSVSAVPPASVNLSSSVKEDENTSFPGQRSSSSIVEIGLGRGIVRGSVAGVISSQPSNSVPLGSGSIIPSNGALVAIPAASDIAKRNILGTDERIGSSDTVQTLVSPLSNRILLPQVSKANEGTGSSDSNNVSDPAVIGGRVFSPSVVPGVQWRPGSLFQNQVEVGQFHGRTEIAPDQREKLLQWFHQVQQQSQPGVSHLTGGNHKQFSAQQQTSLLQQFNSQNSTLLSQVGLGLGVQAPGLNTVTSNSLQQSNSIQQQSAQHALNLPAPKDLVEDQQQQQSSSEDVVVEPVTSSGLNRNLLNEDDMKATYSVDSAAAGSGSGSLIEPVQVPRDIDLSPGQPLQSNRPSVSLGVIGRRSVSDLGPLVITSVGQLQTLEEYMTIYTICRCSSLLTTSFPNPKIQNVQRIIFLDTLQ
ncbi:uncharacterized protein LOC122088963 [Macadamia integrifolia]|uniref:uncharacterized protein LOC122088963 n=1 Tax=Macadamia integrifolia TaxID=60698 RepID=UPI001C500CD8|nr:uncharacterized protein LOC122088963 [Macadamia integrifolia]